MYAKDTYTHTLSWQMGACVSKCRSKKRKYIEEDSIYVQDKLVISQPQLMSPIIPVLPARKPLSPSPSPSSTTSSFSCSSAATATSTLSLSCTTSSSSSSSILTSKDRSFSNEFLWSCAKENPQIMRLDPINASIPLHSSLSTKAHARKLASPAEPAVPLLTRHHSSTANIPQRPVGSTSIPRKRARPSSPTLSRPEGPNSTQYSLPSSPNTLTRQRSFRREPERPNSTQYFLPSRALSSPSPSRRFTGGNFRGASVNTANEWSYKRDWVGSKPFHSSELPLFVRIENNLRPNSLNNSASRRHGRLRSREAFAYQFGSKVGDNNAAEEVVSRTIADTDSIPVEDIDNPLIALDCFIFL